MAPESAAAAGQAAAYTAVEAPAAAMLCQQRQQQQFSGVAVAAAVTAEARLYLLGLLHLSGPRSVFCLLFLGIQYNYKNIKIRI
jgi:hypothetical protein